ncbi:MAG TPA: TonB-dependent receptor [Vicinamibacterales bacterium]
MPRFYLALAGLVVATFVPAVAGAQTSPSPTSGDRPPLGSSLTVDALGSLPAGPNLFTLLDTTGPDVITDRLETGVLGVGETVRSGAHGSTWTQTLYRLGDAELTDPGGTGTPLLIPGVSEWESVDIATGIMPMVASAPGMAVTLVPRRASSSWTNWLDVAGSPSGLNSGPPKNDPPAIARLNSAGSANLVLAGPLIQDSLGAFINASYSRSSDFERDSTQTLDSSLGSIFANLMATPTTGNAVRMTGWFQGSRGPLAHHDAFGQPTSSEQDRAATAQLSWDRQLADRPVGLSFFGGYTQRGRTPNLQASPAIVIERLTDGPVQQLLDPGNGTDRLIQVGAHLNADRVTGPNRRHQILGGIELVRGSTSNQSAFTGRVGETVNGLPARVWDWTDPASVSSWHATTMSLFAADTLSLNPRFTLNVGLRFETVRGSASDGSAEPVTWNDWFPRGGLHIHLTDLWQIAAFMQFGRYGYRLPLRDLAYGDPTAPTASVYRWNGGSLSNASSLGPLIERWGPGSGGDPNFSGIDKNLRRPAMNEMTFGFESRPRPYAFVRMAAIARYDSPLVGVVNVGVPESSYTTIGVPDTGIDRIGSQDDQTLIFYNRSPSTYGADRYLLSNPTSDDDWATYVGVDFVGEVHAKRLFLIAGGTAGRSEGLSANRGFGPLENDASVLGEVFIDPNARTYAQGRLFTERGYTLKTAMSYSFDHDITAGIVGRYEDGQHFARMVVLDGLNQGAEAVRAFRNGRTRFTFSMTVDTRVQKGFTIGGRRFVASLDAYNLFNQSNSVEEEQVTGAGPRVETAVQPPRSVRIAVRIPF